MLSWTEQDELELQKLLQKKKEVLSYTKVINFCNSLKEALCRFKTFSYQIEETTAGLEAYIRISLYDQDSRIFYNIMNPNDTIKKS